ncbi:MAG: cellulase family glycosylhydrolase [Deltaproteobacteria bacterium]|nr:cellulase family glycosylhydrolase [Deltaproteobacteria bacterium]
MFVVSLIASQVAAEKPQFVQVSGTRFVIGDKPFFFVGANLNVMHGPKARRLAKQTIAAAARDGLTVGRIWALGEGLASAPDWQRQDFLFRAGPHSFIEGAYQQLDKVVAWAKEHGVYLVITLSNRWADYGGIPMYLRWAGDRDTEAYGYSDRFFTNTRVKRWFAAHIKRIVGRVNSVNGVPYRDDPTIMAWELQNEMVGTPEAEAVRRAWFVEMSEIIRSIDDNHMIVPGLIGYNLQLERESWLKMCGLPQVAYCDQHIYPEEHLRSRGLKNLKAYIDDRVQLAHYVVKKPIVFGEFGFADRGAIAARARWHRLFLRRLFDNGGNGALVWIYQPTLDWTRRYGVLIDKPRYRGLRRVLAQAARRAKGAKIVNTNPLLGPERGTAAIAPTHATVWRRRSAWRNWQTVRHGVRQLVIPVDQFYRAYFEEAGSWDGGILVHAYGRRTGFFEYRLSGLDRRAKRVWIRLRLSSEYPGSSAPADGFSRVRVSLNGEQIAALRLPPDDGVGRQFTITIDDEQRLKQWAGRLLTLRLEVVEGDQANGVAIYGRETPLNREPVDSPEGITLIASGVGP